MTDVRPFATTCRFLGLLKDPDDTVNVPWPEHRCYSTGRPASVAKGTQGLYCLSSGHQSCPRFVLAKNIQSIPDEMPSRALAPRPAAPPPAEEPEERKSLSERFGPLMTLALRAGLVAAVVTLIVSLDFAFFRSMRTDTVRGEGQSTPGPTITTYTLAQASPTVAIPPTPGVSFAPGVQPPVIASPTPGVVFQAPIVPTAAAAVPTIAQLYPTTQPIAPAAPRLATAIPEPAMAGPATASLQPSEGPAGTAVTLLGVYWSPNSEVLLRWGTQPNEDAMNELGTARANANGAFTGYTRVPAVGQGTIYLGVRQGNKAAYLPFRVMP